MTSSAGYPDSGIYHAILKPFNKFHWPKMKFMTIISIVPIDMNEVPLGQRIVYDASCTARHTSIKASAKDCIINNAAMQDAMEAVNRGMSIRSAVKAYGVARSILHDRVSGKTKGD